MLNQAQFCCEACGQPLERPDQEASWGAMKLRGRALTFAGESSPLRLRESHVQLLRGLMRTGMASREGLRMRLDRRADGVTTNLVYVQICKLRRVLLAANVPCQITTMTGWGYCLEPLSN